MIFAFFFHENSQGKGTMITYWLKGEKPINNNVQQANPMTTISQISNLQDPSAVAAPIQAAPSKQQEQRAFSPANQQHKAFQDQQSEQQAYLTQQSIQSRSQESRMQQGAHPDHQQRPQEPQQQHQGLATQPRSQSSQTNPSPLPNQIQNQKPAAINPACGLAVTGNGAPKLVTARTATPIGNSSPARSRASGPPSANNSVHQVYPATESMPNYTESGPNAPLLLPAGAVPRV